MSPDGYNRRILLVDDNQAIHEDFKRVLMKHTEASTIDAEAEALFGDAGRVAELPLPDYQIDFALQGEEALVLVSDSVASKRPYAMAFVDMRMPPGWDGLTTITKLWEVDPMIQIVICTAYSDRSWHDIQTTLTARDHWLILKKPFDKVEVLQLAQALTDKWNLTRMASEHRSNLEALVRERTDQLRAAVQVKNEFMANMSHELMTPMNGIIGMLSLIQSCNLGSEEADFVRIALQCSESLAEFLGQILVFNQAEAGTIALNSTTFSLKALLTSIEGTYRERAKHKGIRLQTAISVGTPDTVSAPEVILHRILRTLVDNAVKFTQEGVVTVRAAREGERLSFTVIDTGIGMTPEQLRFVSIPFAKADGGLTRQFGGVGLGLALARRLVESLGGEIEVHSEVGIGTTVVFTALAGVGAPLEPISV